MVHPCSISAVRLLSLPLLVLWLLSSEQLNTAHIPVSSQPMVELEPFTPSYYIVSSFHPGLLVCFLKALLPYLVLFLCPPSVDLIRPLPPMKPLVETKDR